MSENYYSDNPLYTLYNAFLSCQEISVNTSYIRRLLRHNQELNSIVTNKTNIFNEGKKIDMKKILSLIIALTVVLTVTSFCFGAQASTALTPEDKKLIAQLQPPATAEERAMFEEIKNNPGEVTKFIATRQYFWKLREMFPNGKIDPARAPFPSADVKIKYTLQENNNEEWGWLFSIDYALIKKGITPPER